MESGGEEMMTMISLRVTPYIELGQAETNIIGIRMIIYLALIKINHLYFIGAEIIPKSVARHKGLAYYSGEQFTVTINRYIDFFLFF